MTAPVRKRPFPSWPRLGDEEVAAATAVLRANELSHLAGPQVAEFEAAFADSHGASHCVAMNSGTSAIHAVLVALGIGPGDEILVPAHTFVATASPVAQVGATPVFVDIDPETYCMDPDDAARRVTARTAAVIPVHLNGHPAPLAELCQLAERHGLALIEDACQSHGARYDGRPVGTFGVASCFSFWHDKTITTGGEGGAVLTDDPELADRLRKVRNHGESPAPGERLYHHVLLGHNYRMTSVQAAIGTVQVGRLAGYVRTRRANADFLTAALRDLPGVAAPGTGPRCEPAPWKYVCRLTVDPAALDLLAFLTALNAEGIPAARRYPIPLHRQPIFSQAAAGQRFPAADRAASTLFSLPVHPAVTEQDLQDCVDAMEKVLRTYGTF